MLREILSTIFQIFKELASIYFKASNSIDFIDSMLKEYFKNFAILVLLMIPLILSIWGFSCFSLFLYFTQALALVGYVAGLIVVGINLLFLGIVIIWYYIRNKQIKQEKANKFDSVLNQLEKLVCVITNSCHTKKEQ